jgi:hypothetical protein
MKAMRANLGPTVLRAHPGMRTRRSLKGTRLPHPGKWHLPNRQIPTTKGRLLAEGQEALVQVTSRPAGQRENPASTDEPPTATLEARKCSASIQRPRCWALPARVEKKTSHLPAGWLANPLAMPSRFLRNRAKNQATPSRPLKKPGPRRCLLHLAETLVVTKAWPGLRERKTFPWLAVMKAHPPGPQPALPLRNRVAKQPEVGERCRERRAQAQSRLPARPESHADQLPLVGRLVAT